MMRKIKFEVIAILLLIFGVMDQVCYSIENIRQDSAVYKNGEDFELKLHIFKPADSNDGELKPGIVFFSGGGWVKSGPVQFFPHAKVLALRGMTAVVADYRTSHPYGVEPRVCLSDAKSAIRWVRSHSKELGIDPERLAAGGGSAGGQLAAAAALVEGFNDRDDEVDISCKPNALVLFNPVIDNSEKGYGYDRVIEYWEEFSPLHNIKEGAPPTIIMIGTKDHLVPVSTVKEYKRLMEENGGRCDLVLYEGQEHAFFNYMKGKNPYYHKTVKQMVEFLKSIDYLQD